MLTTTCVTCRHPLPELCTCTGTHTAPPIYPCPGAFRLPIPKARLPSFSDTCPCSPDSHSLATPSPGRETPGAPAQEGAQLARGRHWILRGLHVRSAPSPFKHCTSAPRPSEQGAGLRPHPATQPHSACGSHRSLASQGRERGSPDTSPQGAHTSPPVFRCLAPLKRSVAHCEGDRGPFSSPPHVLPVLQQRKNSPPALPCPPHPIAWTSVQHS